MKNACAQYEQVASADPPIPCQWRSRYGNSYAVVMLSDMAALKERITKQAAEEKKIDVIAKFGQEYYDKLVAKEKAREEAAVAAYKRECTVHRLVREVEAAMAFSSDGIADTLEGITISKTNAKKDWYIAVDGLSPVDPSKKNKKYRLSDVIGGAIKTLSDTKLADKISSCPEKKRLYARYLLDKFEDACQNVDASIVKAVHASAREFFSKRVETKAAELQVAEESLEAFDSMIDGMKESTTAAGAGAAKVSSVTPDKPSAKKARTR